MSEKITEISITVTKETIQHSATEGHYPPSRSFYFQGEPLTPSDQRDLIETLASDLVRRIDDFQERAIK